MKHHLATSREKTTPEEAAWGTRERVAKQTCTPQPPSPPADLSAANFFRVSLIVLLGTPGPAGNLERLGLEAGEHHGVLVDPLGQLRPDALPRFRGEEPPRPRCLAGGEDAVPLANDVQRGVADPQGAN